MTDEEKKAEAKAEAAEQRLKTMFGVGFLLLIVMAFLAAGPGLKWYRNQAAANDATQEATETPKTEPETTAPNGPICDAGIVDASTLWPGFLVQEGSSLVLYLVCDGYPAASAGEITVIPDKGEPRSDVFSLSTVEGSTIGVFVAELGTPPAGLYRVEVRIGGRVVATTFTRVVRAETQGDGDQPSQ